MFSVLYIIWFILPFSLFMLGVWAWLKKTCKIHGREYAGEYFSQGMFCLIGLGICIWIDQTFYEGLIKAIGLGFIDIRAARWLLYPGMLTLMVYIHKLYKAKVSPENTHVPPISVSKHR